MAIRLLDRLRGECDRMVRLYFKKEKDRLGAELQEVLTRGGRLEGRLADMEREIAAADVSPRQVAALEALRDRLGQDLDVMDMSARRELLGLPVDKAVVLPGEVVIGAAVPDAEKLAQGWAQRGARQSSGLPYCGRWGGTRKVGHVKQHFLDVTENAKILWQARLYWPPVADLA